MHIPPEACANFGHLTHEAVSPATSSERNSRASSMSVGLVILILRSLPCTTWTSISSRRSTRLDSSVPVKPSLRASVERALEQLEPEHLRSLRHHQVLARKRRADLVLVYLLDGVHRDDPDNRRAGLPRFGDHAFHQIGIDERAYRVVHRDEVGIRRQGRQARSRRIPAGSPRLRPREQVWRDAPDGSGREPSPCLRRATPPRFRSPRGCAGICGWCGSGSARPPAA